MRYLIIVLLILCNPSLWAQDKTVTGLQAEASRTVKQNPLDTIPRAWKRGGMMGLNISQGSLNNWAAGGDNFSLSVNSILSLYAFYKNGRHSWDNSFDFNYGLIKSTSLGTRKNDDRLDLFSKYGYGISEHWSIATLANFRTQLFKGYTYDEGIATLSSAFLSPAYALLGVGLDFKPNPAFSLYLSPLTGRVTLVSDDSLAAKGAYGVEPGQNTKWELGAFLSANYIKAFNDVLGYKARLDLYSNYRRNPEKIDLFMTNVLSIKLSRVLSATWNVDLIYDDDIRLFGENKDEPALQLKSLIGIGFLVKFDNMRAAAGQ